MAFSRLSRRGLFRQSGWLAAAGFLQRNGSAAPARELHVGPDIYGSIGVRPIINCKGTFTIISGSQSLPEVKAAMLEASRHYVHLDELMGAVSARLAELTKAEWGIVTAGCAAALTHSTAACIAGADPEKMQRLPKLDGLKSEVVVPKHSRNVYDHAVRMLGVKMIEVTSAEELDRAFSPRTAMAMVLAAKPADSGPLSTEAVARAAKLWHVPVIVDAAAENLTIPNIHLQRGADLVAYSGGKCLRGPQAAGLLLGRKDLVQAAWINSAPHHAFGRSLKVGKEEIMGMLAAVEMWVKRDHEAEWNQWLAWLNFIGGRATQIAGVTTEIQQPEDLSNHAPQLRLQWDAAKLGITGREAEKVLFEGEPRIIFGGSGGDRQGDRPSSLTIMPYMMMPEDHKVVAEAIYAVLSKPPSIPHGKHPDGPPANAAGQWAARLTYVSGVADHTLMLEQKENKLAGTHRGGILEGDLRGNVMGDEVSFRSGHHYEGTTIGYDFQGKIAGDTMEGMVSLGEYGKAQWTAKRRQYGAPAREG